MQSLATIIEESIRSHNSELQLFPRITENDVYMAIRQVMRDNPDIFWFSHQWCYSRDDAKAHFRYTIDEKHSQKITALIDDVVQNDFKLEYVRSLSVKEQMMYVYKWIALYCNYTIHSAHNQTIYSVFVHRHSVCTGIAKAAQYLLKLLCIESRLVFGKMNNSGKDSRHCWLIVNIEGRWYHLDPTFAIPETEHLLHQCGVQPAKGDDSLFYNFFCVDTDTIKQSHAIEELEMLPVCKENMDYTILQKINVSPSRNGCSTGLGCLLSNVGSTADIYLAHNEDKYDRHRFVAKVFRDDENHELLRKELIVMRECAGPHLLRAGGSDFSKGILYMEQATPLSDLLASHYYKLTLKGFCNLLTDIASGLKELQDHGIFYRDIHLNNIYLYEDSLLGKLTYKLGDFGSCTFTDKDDKYAGLTDRGGVGSKWYMAPETWNEGIFDERSSVYGVGMIAYYLLNDLYPPFWQEYGEESLGIRMQSHRLPTPSNLQERECCKFRMDFIFKSLNNAPSERYQTLSELIDAINECKQVNLDRLLIEGSQFKTVDRKPMAETFCSTCEVNPSVKVSNGEVGVATVDIDGESNDDVLLVDGNADGQLDSFDTTDTSSQINDFATTCGGRSNNYDGLTSVDAVEFARPSLHKDDFARTCIPYSPKNAAPYDENRQQDKHSESYFPFGSNSSSRTSSDRLVRCAPQSSPKNAAPYDENRQQDKHSESYFPFGSNGSSRTSLDWPVYGAPKSSPAPSSRPSKGMFGKIKDLIFGKSENPTPTTPIERKPIAEKVNSSIFAPSEAKRGDYLMVQVFLYKDGEECVVACKAAEVDPDARRQNYTPLSVKLMDGDKVKVKLMMSGKGIEVDEPIQEMIWQRHYTDCQFGVFVPEEYKPSSMLGTVIMTVNDVPCGRMMFKTKIVRQPQKLYAKIESKVFHKIFISYSHKDEATVKYFAKAYQAQGVDYFFDRHYLKAGDVYPLMIREYINSADLFILCWSKNAAESDYVQLERQQALALAFPQKDMEQATLSIHPISIEPHADYPSDMKEVYNFEEI